LWLFRLKLLTNTLLESTYQGVSLITQHLKYKGSELITICKNQHGVPESTSLEIYPLRCHKYEISPFLFGQICFSKWFHEGVMIGTYMDTCDTGGEGGKGRRGGGGGFLPFPQPKKFFPGRPGL